MRRALPALFAIGCTAITHATAYRTAPDARACAPCPNRPDLRHAPCPPASAPSAAEAEYVFALRSVDLGADPSDPSYAVGLDLDCSDRPNAGAPVECATGTEDPPDFRWAQLPRGIDNALGAQTFAALRASAAVPASVRDLDGTLGRALEAGRTGMILTLDGWNGLADDDDVRPRIQVARGVTSGSPDCAPTAGPAPKWDGSDVWDVYEGTGFSGGTAYVTGGQLVWDARAVPVALHLENGPGVLDMRLLETILVGAIFPDRAPHLVVSARWSAASAHLPFGFLTAEDPATACALHHALPWIQLGPPLAVTGPLFADVMTAPTATRVNANCEATSVGLGLGFARAAGAVAVACAPRTPADFEPRCLDDGGVAP